MLQAMCIPNYLSADEARKIADKAYYSILHCIYSKIRLAAQRGMHSVLIDECNISDDIKEYLEKQGYILEKCYGRDMLISW